MIAEQETIVVTEESKTKDATKQPIVLEHEVRHEVAIPDDPNFTYTPLSEWKAPEGFVQAREYPFTLDPFQRLAVTCLERHESVLVSAHTSAGKTVVAEYAIAMALRDKQRVVYTSPIKALSNQKYRELQAAFGDVGLMTGDVTLSPEASCLVMTTEILRSMLYRGSEVLREVSWVIYDEIHYMRDKERGVVWEESLIMIPSSVRFVFLSATIPNAKQFASWICHLHAQPCHVVYTNYRPTPLQHYLFPKGSDGLFLVVDERGVFREENFKKALNAAASASGSESSPHASASGASKDDPLAASKKRIKYSGSSSGSSAGGSDLYKIIKLMAARNFHPVIVFSFSKRDCEKYAMQMSRLDFNTDQERATLMHIFRNAMETIQSEEDRHLPQIENMVPLLQKGIGIHHGGLLPILKEVIELLFQEGLLKVLFATETFSIGLNMPAKTVLFTSARKFDGKDFRWLTSGEYIQMSGRAGRRGLDDRGIVILMTGTGENERGGGNGTTLDPATCKAMIKGSADPLNSAFHLSYSMILNLMRVEGCSPEGILERSFFQFQSAQSLPKLQEHLNDLHEKSRALVIPDQNRLEHYAALLDKVRVIREDYRRIVHHAAHVLPFLQPGRLVRIRTASNGSGSPRDYGWCTVLSVTKKAPTTPSGNNSSRRPIAPQYLVDVLAKDDPELGNVTTPPRIVTVPLSALDGVSSIRLHLPHDIKPADARLAVQRNVEEVKRRFKTAASPPPNSNPKNNLAAEDDGVDCLPLLDPIVDMRIQDEAFRKLLERMAHVDGMIRADSMHNNPSLPQWLGLLREKRVLAQEIAQTESAIRQATSILQMEELRARRAVLRALGYTDASDIIQLKGRVACDISTGDELLLTELLFANAFTEDMHPDQMVALLSCFVCEEKPPPASAGGASKKDHHSNPNPSNGGSSSSMLAQPLRLLQETAKRIVKVSGECGLKGEEADEQVYLERLRPELMEVVYAWCRGAKFAQICMMTEVFEGNIIRCLRRLEELLRQMSQAASTIGNAELVGKFDTGIEHLKRDIVFANSLYL